MGQTYPCPWQSQQFFWRALLLTQLMDDLAISLFHLMVICFRQIFLNYTYRLVFHW